MRIDTLGIPIYDYKDIENLLYKGITTFDNIVVENGREIQDFNQSLEIQSKEKLKIYEPIDISKKDFDNALQSDWKIPEEYKKMDIEGFLVHVCPKQHYQRLIEELQEYRERNMLDLLKWLKYFVDTCRKEGIVWGVGRGSSVSSYVLFLLGVHKIDSVKYNLDWHEFLR